MRLTGVPFQRRILARACMHGAVEIPSVRVNRQISIFAVVHEAGILFPYLESTREIFSSESSPPAGLSTARFPHTKMASIVLPTQTVTDATSDVGILWKAAVARYENITMTKVECLPRANNADMIIDEIYRREAMLKAQRHDGSKLDKFRSLINKSLSPIEKIGNIVASAASTVRSHFCLARSVVLICIDVTLVFPS